MNDTVVTNNTLNGTDQPTTAVKVADADSIGFEVPFLITVCVLGFIGNGLVCAVYSQKKNNRHNSSIYIINLAVGKYAIYIVLIN